MSIFVCIPTARDIDSRTTEAAFRICANHSGGAEFRTVQASPADYARNLGVDLFLESPHSHILFIDSDVVPPDNSLDLMLAVNRPIVCGIYPLLLRSTICMSVARRCPDNTYDFFANCGNEPFEVDAGGMGCCLIERSVLERLDRPWFCFSQRSDGTLFGEDLHFFEKAAGLGVRPLAVPQVQCSHFRVVDLLDVVRAVSRAGTPPLQPLGV